MNRSSLESIAAQVVSQLAPAERREAAASASGADAVCARYRAGDLVSDLADAQLLVAAVRACARERLFPRPGRFEDTTVYVRPDGGAFRQFKVRCAVTLRREHGSSAPGPAKRMLRELGWDYLPRLGWVSPEGLLTLGKEGANE